MASLICCVAQLEEKATHLAGGSIGRRVEDEDASNVEARQHRGRPKRDAEHRPLHDSVLDQLFDQTCTHCSARYIATLISSGVIAASAGSTVEPTTNQPPYGRPQQRISMSSGPKAREWKPSLTFHLIDGNCEADARKGAALAGI